MIGLPQRHLSLPAGLVSVAASLLVLCPGASAQVGVPTDIGAPDQQPALTSQEVQALQSAPPSNAPATRASSPSRGGPEVSLNGQPVAETPRRFRYELSVTVRGVYDDNIYISSFNRTSDYYFTIEPSISLWLGSGDEGHSSLSLVYRPSLFLFAQNSNNDSVQHIIHLQGAHGFGHLSLSLSQDVQILDGQNLNSLSDPTGHQANIDVGARTQHQIYTTALGASYDLTGKLFLSAAGAIAADQYKTQISSQSFSGNMFLNYNYSEKLVIGVGGTGGYNTTDNSVSDQTFEQANVRMSYNATAKISLSASGGVEFRQSAGNSTTNISPVYTLSASYQPFDGTSISLSGSRSTQNSAVFTGQDFADTTINLSLNQRLVQRVFFGFAVGYTNSNYFSVLNGVSATRNDNYYYIEPSLDTNITRYWTVGAYYLHREDSSSFSSFSFYDNQVGLRTKLTF
jgi:hypothetical protein